MLIINIAYLKLSACSLSLLNNPLSLYHDISYLGLLVALAVNVCHTSIAPYKFVAATY